MILLYMNKFKYICRIHLLPIMKDTNIYLNQKNKMKNENVIDYVSSTLKWKILNGQYSIGEHITEISVAEELGVSRNSVRTAVIKLTEEGFLERNRGHGVMVRNISIKEANEIIDLRIILETYAVKEAIKNISNIQISSLKAILISMKSAIENKDFELYSSLNTRFHNLIYESSRNTVIQSTITELKTKMLRYQFKVAFISGRPDKSYIEHQNIFKAIENRDISRAEKTIRDHLESLRMCIDNNRQILELKEV